MASHTLKWAKNAIKKPSLSPIRFPTTGHRIITDTLEEERFAEFKKGQYYPANVGDVFNLDIKLRESSDMSRWMRESHDGSLQQVIVASLS